MTWRIITGDCRDVLPTLPASSVHTVVTSPPYFGLRDYNAEAQIGLEPTPDEFVAALVEAKRNTLGNGVKQKDLIGIPWMVAFALRADGWYLRSDIIWAKPSPMPESVTDRPTRSHEHIFLLSKRPRYHFDADAIREPHSREWWTEPVGPGYMTAKDGRKDGGKRRGSGNENGRNKRDVWTIATQPYTGTHFAAFPPKLIEPCVLAGCPEGGTVLDPFAGAGTTGVVALRHSRSFTGIELNPEYVELARWRIRNDAPLLNVSSEVAA